MLETRSVHDFGAVGDGVVDDTEALQHAVDQHTGLIYFPPGDYLISKSIVVQLKESGRVGFSGAGGTAKIIMTGAAPAILIQGTHNRTASPESFSASVWSAERMPTLQNLEIEGRHENADGILIARTMQCTLEGVLLRGLRHGVHIKERARNVLISHCHIYDNRGIGIFLEQANVHQIIICSSHVSYNSQSGIKILNGEVRNIQISGNDIEYNYDRKGKEEPLPSAEIWIDTSGQGASIREGTICSNTIQSRYSPGGANILINGSGAETNKNAGMLAISGNLIGSQECNVKLVSCRAISLSGNVIYSGHLRNLEVSGSRNIVCTGNTFDHNPDYLPMELATGILFSESTDCLFTGCCIQDAYAGEHTVNTPAELKREALLEIDNCQRMTVNACQISDASEYGLLVRDSDYVNISNCTILDKREETKMKYAVTWRGSGENNLLQGNLLGKGIDGLVDIAESAGVLQP